MDKIIALRIQEEAEYLIKTKDTIRKVAKHFGLSKSTVHKDIKEKLEIISPEMNKNVRKILEEHIKERHIKGGEKTKEKYAKKRA